MGIGFTFVGETLASSVGPVGEAPQLANHLYATYRFLTGQVGDFLSTLDTQ